MSPQLGLVCITASQEVRYRTITRKRLLEAAPATQRKLLDEIYRDNIQTFDGAIRFCEREGISLYRVPSSIFPFLDEDIGRECIAPLSGALAKSGARAREKNIRLVMHPDQFVVLTSDSEDVVANSNLIDTMPSCYLHAPWIEIEAKSKEEAIKKLGNWPRTGVIAAS
jgi:UV DNA damage endonuclease